MADDFHLQHVHRFSRQSYNTKAVPVADYHHEHFRDLSTQARPPSPRRQTEADDEPGCSCDRETEEDIAGILHKKCAVITLAKQQLQMLLDTERYMCYNTRNYRSVYNFLRFIKETLTEQSKCQCILMMLIGIAFSLGLLLGACSCGSYLGRFESPILTCLDNMFTSESTTIQQSFRGIF